MTQITTRTNAGNVYLRGRKFADGLAPTVGDTLEEEMPDLAREASGGYPDGSYSGYTVPYARPREGQQAYQRTGIYGGSTNWERNGLAYTVSNSAPYAPYVGGRADGTGQAWMHVGRWPIIARVVERWLNKITGKLEDAIDQLAVTTIGSTGGYD